MSKTEIVLNKSDAVVGKVGVLDDNELSAISGGVSNSEVEGSIWVADALAGTGKKRKIDSDTGIRRIDR
jgi:bacteriocin-like protein